MEVSGPGGRAVAWLMLALGLLMASLLATWYAWGAVNFGYRYWHDTIGIGAAIERYAPENRYRHGFALTTVDERARLFGAIVEAVNGNTEILGKLRYHAPDGRVLGRLLRPPEIRHLKDVARMIAQLKVAAVLGTLVALAITALAIMRRWPLPPLRAFAGGALAAGGLIALILLVVGPADVFDMLHVWAFPSTHQWFFYYEESLMTTMMYAPTLFGAIAAEWAASALLLFAVLLAVQRALHRRLTAVPRGPDAERKTG